MFPSTRIPFLPMSLKIELLHAHQSTLDSQARAQLSKPCSTRPRVVLRTLGAQRNVTHRHLGGAMWEMASDLPLKGSSPVPLPFPFCSQVKGNPGKYRGFAHTLLSHSVYFLCLSRHMWKKPPLGCQSQMRKRQSSLFKVLGQHVSERRIPGDLYSLLSTGTQLPGFEVQWETCGVGRKSRARCHRSGILKIKLTGRARCKTGKVLGQ